MNADAVAHGNVAGRKPRLVVTMGDPLSAGPELICRALAIPQVRQRAQFLILGDAQCLAAARRITGASFEWQLRTEARFCDEPGLLEPAAWLGGDGAWRGERTAPGAWTPESGRQSLEYVREGARLCLSGAADALVTNAICKAAWQAAGGRWPGHTELLAELTGCHDEVMMLAGAGLRVALATIHEPLARVPQLLTQERVCKVARILARDLRERFGLSEAPIAVLGLNPHAGEEGHIGDEEIRVIAPAIRQLQAEGIRAIGPVPADTAFHRMLQGEFAAILAMYHDQGLAALKTVAFDSGVNITLGLPLIRTSVDHGTAFDLAGTGRAKPDSLLAAIDCACRMCAGG